MFEKRKEMKNCKRCVVGWRGKIVGGHDEPVLPGGKPDAGAYGICKEGKDICEPAYAYAIHGAWPVLLAAAPESDIDQDGIPDIYEESHNLNKASPKDSLLDTDNDGYSALEEYLQSLLR